jgi:cell division protein FtsL
MKRKRITFLVLLICFFISVPVFSSVALKNYHTQQQINAFLKQVSNTNQNITNLKKLAVSPGNRPVYLLEIGSETKAKLKKNSAVLVIANPEGDLPISSEAALMLIDKLIKDKKNRAGKTWYIIPALNPDASAKYFTKPLFVDRGNDKPFNDDMDDQVDEDGPDDLDGNGIITLMRVKRPNGNKIPVKGEPRLMKRPDWKKGEQGIYKLYTEGIDNDGDGKINEDPRGGINVGINFPHLFKFFTKKGGSWSGSEVESFNLMKFVSEHREIAMSMVFGSTNFCLSAPKGGRRGIADFNKIKIPKNIAKMFNADSSKTYKMKEILELAKNFVPPGMELTEGMVASFLGLGAVVNPLPADLKFYNKLAKDYKEFLKKNKVNINRYDPQRAKNGSLELWSYYHLGIPSFSLDFFTLPKKEKKKKKDSITPQQLAKMSNKEFLALGEEKINAFLKSAGAPAGMKAKNIIGAVKGGMLTPKKMADMMKQMGNKSKSKDATGADE